MNGIAIVLVLLIIFALSTWSTATKQWLNIADIYKSNAHVRLLEGRDDLSRYRECYSELSGLRDPAQIEFLHDAKSRGDFVWTLRRWEPTRIILNPSIIRQILDNPHIFAGLIPHHVEQFQQLVLGSARPYDLAHTIARDATRRTISDFMQKIVASGNDFEELGLRIACEVVLGKSPLNARKLLSEGQWQHNISKIWSNPNPHTLVANAKVLQRLYRVENVFDLIRGWITSIAVAVATYIPLIFVLLYSHPEVSRALDRDSSSVNMLHSPYTHLHRAVLECIRLYNNMTSVSKTAIHDIQIDGLQLRAGDQFILPIVALTRDRVCFPNHNTFDITRWEDASAAHHYVGHPNINPVRDLVVTIVKAAVSEINAGVEYEVLEPVVDRDNLPHIIAPMRLRMGMKRRKAVGFGDRFRDI